MQFWRGVPTTFDTPLSVKSIKERQYYVYNHRYFSHSEMLIRVRSWHASIDCFDCYNIHGNAFALIHTEGVARTVKSTYLWCAIQRNGTFLASKMNQWGIKCLSRASTHEYVAAILGMARKPMVQKCLIATRTSYSLNKGDHQRREKRIVNQRYSLFHR